jgi:biopolymer transport protein ExbB
MKTGTPYLRRWLLQPSFFVSILIAVLQAPVAPAQTEPESLQALLLQTRDARAREQNANREREQRFIESRDRQAEFLEQGQARLSKAREMGESLSDRFDSNETDIADLRSGLDARAGTLGEMFGVVRLAAGDAASIMHNSILSAQHQEREGFLTDLAASAELPNIEELERLWFELQREMTDTGTVEAFDATVVGADGTEANQRVVRVGPFTAVSGGTFLGYDPQSQRFSALSRQPPGRYLGIAEQLATATTPITRAVIDPTRGSLLSVLVQQPGLRETIENGGLVGYLIMTLAAVGIIIALGRALRLAEIQRAVSRQKKNINRPHDNNPLGRVLAVYQDDPDIDKDMLQLRLDEAVLKEIPPLEAGLGAIKILAAIGPLLGLLGTVTGMIITFQQITLFGTGDPKLMAGGISQALVTTVMGLVMAIPLLLLHSYLSSRSGNLVQLLDEETAGLIAEQAENQANRNK